MGQQSFRKMTYESCTSEIVISAQMEENCADKRVWVVEPLTAENEPLLQTAMEEFQYGF